jgi:hypothetical protein
VLARRGVGVRLVALLDVDLDGLAPGRVAAAEQEAEAEEQGREEREDAKRRASGVEREPERAGMPPVAPP